MSAFYITTAIHYVNDDPHIGHMYENIVADVIAPLDLSSLYARYGTRGGDPFAPELLPEKGNRRERLAAWTDGCTAGPVTRSRPSTMGPVLPASGVTIWPAPGSVPFGGTIRSSTACMSYDMRWSAGRRS